MKKPNGPVEIKFLAISENTDDQVTHYDHIMAVSEERALSRIAELRPDCIPIAAFTLKNILECADDLIRDTEAGIRAHMAELAAEVEAQS